jgi:hypothetical protein
MWKVNDYLPPSRKIGCIILAIFCTSLHFFLALIFIFGYFKTARALNGIFWAQSLFFCFSRLVLKILDLPRHMRNYVVCFMLFDLVVLSNLSGYNAKPKLVNSPTYFAYCDSNFIYWMLFFLQ